MASRARTAAFGVGILEAIVECQACILALLKPQVVEGGFQVLFFTCPSVPPKLNFRFTSLPFTFSGVYSASAQFVAPLPSGVRSAAPASLRLPAVLFPPGRPSLLEAEACAHCCRSSAASAAARCWAPRCSSGRQADLTFASPSNRL